MRAPGPADRLSIGQRVFDAHALLSMVGARSGYYDKPYRVFHDRVLTGVVLGQVLFGYGKFKHLTAPSAMLVYAMVDDIAHRSLSQGGWPLNGPSDWVAGDNIWVTDVMGLPPYTKEYLLMWRTVARTAGLQNVYYRRDYSEAVTKQLRAA